MAASRTGALVAGFYLGTALAFSGKLYIPVAKERFWFRAYCCTRGHPGGVGSALVGVHLPTARRRR